MDHTALAHFFLFLLLSLCSHQLCVGILFQLGLIGFIIALVRGRRSSIQDEVDKDDFEESDDDLIHA